MNGLRKEAAEKLNATARLPLDRRQESKASTRRISQSCWSNCKAGLSETGAAGNATERTTNDKRQNSAVGEARVVDIPLATRRALDHTPCSCPLESVNNRRLETPTAHWPQSLEPSMAAAGGALR